MREATVSTDMVLRALLFATLKAMPLGAQIDVLKSSDWTDAQIGDAVGLTANAVKKRRLNKKLKEE